jgi:hypothetical protein
MLASCAHAATAAEARYRIDYPNARPRASRIIALDDTARRQMRSVAGDAWSGARFLTWIETRTAPGIQALAVDATLEAETGGRSLLSAELEDADVVIMIASTGSAAAAASVIGNACHIRSIMIAGLIVSAGPADRAADAAIRALRPYAAVLVVASGEDYVPAMLQALRA